MSEVYELEDICNEEQKEKFTISDDKTADWALKIIQKEKADNQRLVKVIDEEIEMLKLKKQKIIDSLENKIGFLKSKLFEYFDFGDINRRELKTCYKYNLPSGELILNKATVKYERDDNKIINWLINNKKDEYIKMSATVNWGELKKTDFVEQIDGVTKLVVPMNFEVK